jgi:hypothetical protein
MRDSSSLRSVGMTTQDNNKCQRQRRERRVLRGLQVEPAPVLSGRQVESPHLALGMTTQEKTNGNGNSNAATANATEKKRNKRMRDSSVYCAGSK